MQSNVTSGSSCHFYDNHRLCMNYLCLRIILIYQGEHITQEINTQYNSWSMNSLMFPYSFKYVQNIYEDIPNTFSYSTIKYIFISKYLYLKYCIKCFKKMRYVNRNETMFNNLHIGLNLVKSVFHLCMTHAATINMFSPCMPHLCRWLF